MIFKGALVCRKDTQKPSEIPVQTLDRLCLYARRSCGDMKKDTKESWETGLEVNITLNYMAEEQPVAQLDDPVEQPCQLHGATMYRSGSGKDASACWRLEASVEGLTVAHLAQFWSAEYVKLEYDYGGDSGEGNSFIFNGKILVGD